MERLTGNNNPARLMVQLLAIILLIPGFCCCTRSFFGEVNRDNNDVGSIVLGTSSSEYGQYLFYQNRQYVPSIFYTQQLGAQVGTKISTIEDQGKWELQVRVPVGPKQFLFGHYSVARYALDYNCYYIRTAKSSGEIGDITESGKWINNYETLIGFRVGSRGFIFGQSRGDNYWFVQEVTSAGRLGAETCTGTWGNYYLSATPLYVGGETYIFFQSEDDNNKYFISHVSSEGVLSDVMEGHWGSFWHPVTSVEVGGKTYLVGHRKGPNEYFIQLINPGGWVMEETEHSAFNNYYKDLIGYSTGGHAYIFGRNENNGYFFIQEITANGKLGTETSNGNLGNNLNNFVPFQSLNPGSFRYVIGWDLSKSTGEPTRSWSGLFTDPWNGEIKMGGGTALSIIDGDASGKYDAVLVGIQDRVGEDRFYYKVAWNLDGTGKASSWSQTLFGPNCGQSQAGGGADIADIDRNGIPDLLIMSVDDPEGVNSFRYNIGWNMGKNGKVASWSSTIQGPSIGNSNSGGGAALGDIDKNGLPDVVFMGIDNPDGANYFWYVIGKNLNQSGIPNSWTPVTKVPKEIGWSDAGGGAALADLDNNGKPDLILTTLDSPTGANTFWCYVGWDIEINGNVSRWSSFTGPKPGNITSGGGTAVGDIDKNGIPDILLMSVNNPYGAD